MLENLNNLMFDNIGRKIKNIAKWTVWIGIVLSAVAGCIVFIACLANFDTMGIGVILTPVLFVVICFIMWLSMSSLYGFGELIEKVSAIADRKNEHKTDTTGKNGDPPKKREESKIKKTIIDAAVDILGPGEVVPEPEKKTETEVISVKGSNSKICLGCGEVVSADTSRCECGCNSFTTEDITVEREVPFTPTSSRMPSTEYNYDIPVDNGDEAYVDCTCPTCGKELSFRKGVKQVVCPWCESEFSI